MPVSSEFYTIGKVSKITGLSLEALRYYHKEGLLVPAFINKKTGYRYYTYNQLNQICLIKKFRELGIGIEELKEIFESGETQGLFNYIVETKKKTERQIAQLELQLEKLATFDSIFSYSHQVMKNDGLTFSEFPKRYLLKLPINHASDELLGYQNLEQLTKTYAIEGAGRGMVFEPDHTGNLSPSYVFFLIEEKDFKMNCDSFSILPAGKYVTVTYDENNEVEKELLLKQYVAEHNLQIDNVIHLKLFVNVFNINSYAWQSQICIEEYDEC